MNEKRGVDKQAGFRVVAMLMGTSSALGWTMGFVGALSNAKYDQGVLEDPKLVSLMIASAVSLIMFVWALSKLSSYGSSGDRGGRRP